MASAFTTAVALRGEQTDGALSVVDNTVPAGWDGPPLHRHAFDETFYVLDGELTFQLRDELFTAGPGALVLAPGGVAHTVANLSAAPAHYLLLCTPAGFERYFARLAAQAAGEEPPTWALAPTPPVTTVGGRIGERESEAATPIAPAEGSVDVLVRGEQTGGRVAVLASRVADARLLVICTPAGGAR
jgi:quercetin dioxygenase-like cupin family protein